MRLRAGLRDWADRPARLVWTLLVSLALFSAVWPVLHYARGFWLHGAQWGFLVNRQNDYGEGPLFNQEVILYHRLFGGGLAADGGTVPGALDPYQLDEHPPFIIGNYPPVFPLVAALFMRAVGPTFMAGRLVSTLAVIGAAILVGLIVWQGTGQVLPAALGFGILISMRDGIWTWGQYNRVDSLALFWSMLTIFVTLRYAGTRRVWWAVPCAILTVFTRQSVVDGVCAGFCFLLVRDWRRGIWVWLVTAAAGLAVFSGLQIWTHGAFYLNTVVDNENAFNFAQVASSWASFIRGEGRFAFPLAVAGAAAGLMGTGNLLWPLWLLGSLFVFATIGKYGSGPNYYLPLEAATSVCAGVFVGRLRTFFRRAPLPLWPLELLLPGMLFVYVHGSPPRWLPPRLPLARQAERLVGGPALSYTPAASLANGQYCECWARPANTAMVTYLRTVSGPVLSIDFPHAVAVQAGHELQWQPFEFSVAYRDGTWNPAPFVDAITARYYAVIITKGGLSGYIGGVFADDIQSAMSSSYHYDRSVGGYEVYARNAPPSGSPPTVPEPVPRPLRGMLAELRQAATHPLGVRAAIRTAFRESAPTSTAAGGNCRRGSAVRVTAGFTLVCLAYNRQVFGVAGEPSPVPCFDQSGDCLDPRDPAWPNHGGPGAATVHGVPFWMPATGGGNAPVRSAVNFGPEEGGRATLPVPAGTYGDLYFIASAGDGPGVADIVFHYAGGSPATQTQRIDDWCAVHLRSALSGASAFLPQDRWSSDGGRTDPSDPGCGVLEYHVPIPNSTQRLIDVVFTSVAGNASAFEPNILALTLR